VQAVDALFVKFLLGGFRNDGKSGPAGGRTARGEGESG